MTFLFLIEFDFSRINRFYYCFLKNNYKVLLLTLTNPTILNFASVFDYVGYNELRLLEDI